MFKQTNDTKFIKHVFTSSYNSNSPTPGRSTTGYPQTLLLTLEVNWNILPKTNSKSTWKLAILKENYYSNNPFSGAMLVSGRLIMLEEYFKYHSLIILMISHNLCVMVLFEKLCNLSKITVPKLGFCAIFVSNSSTKASQPSRWNWK